MTKRRFFQVEHSDVQNAFLDAFVQSGEFVTLVDRTGRYFHGRIVAHDRLSLVLGTKNAFKPLTLFNKRVLTMIVPQNAVQRAEDEKRSAHQRSKGARAKKPQSARRRAAPGAKPT